MLRAVPFQRIRAFSYPRHKWHCSAPHRGTQHVHKMHSDCANQTKLCFEKNHLKTNFQFKTLAHFKHILKTVHFSVMESQSDQRGFFITRSPHFLFCLRGIY